MIFEQRTPFDAYTSKRVSFILTTKNRAERLDSVLTLAREYVKPEDELIVVDGLSTDHTIEVINQHSDMVDVFVSEPDVNTAHALNKGILLSRGKYIRQICDDDVLYPEGLEQAIQVMEKHPEVDLLVCGGTKRKGEHIWTVWLPPGTNYGKSVEDVFRYKAAGVGFIIRRSALPLIGLHPLGTAGDNEFVLQSISRGANVKFCRINLYHHPIHDHSAIVVSAREHEAHQYRLARRYCSRSFYYQYRIRRMLKKHPTALHLLMRAIHVVELLRREGPVGLLQRTGSASRSHTQLESHSSDRDCLWDGGFS